MHAFQLLLIDCNYPRAFVWWIGMHAVMFFFLFKEFYNQSYNKKRRLAAEAAAAASTSTPKAANGSTNGYVYQNGQSKHQNHNNHQPQQRLQNGYHRHTSENGALAQSTSASDYYMNGHIPTEIEQRIKSQ